LNQFGQLGQAERQEFAFLFGLSLFN